MTAPTCAASLLSLPPAGLAKDLIRRYRLRRGARVLDIGSGQGEVVQRLRSSGVCAFGLFDGPALPRDPSGDRSGDSAPAIQPAVLHQGVPFLAQSFDCILLRDSHVYRGSLRGPEACTATANVLASLKPGGPLICCGLGDLDAWEAHLSAFPGQSQRLELGNGGLMGALKHLLGQARTSPAVEFCVPSAPICRLEWHRLARQAVMAAQQPAA